MALKSTIFKAELQITDIDRNHYQNHPLTLACHPSETERRMMIRLLVFALNANERLQFSKGLSTDDEPDLWQKSLSDEIELWIDLGQPDEKRIRKASGRADKVLIYTYNQRSAATWWEQVEDKLQRFDHLSVISLPEQGTEELTGLVQRNMQLNCTIQDGTVWFSDAQSTVEITPVVWR